MSDVRHNLTPRFFTDCAAVESVNESELNDKVRKLLMKLPHNINLSESSVRQNDDEGISVI